MSNLKENFLEALCDTIHISRFDTIWGYEEATRACVSVVIEYLEGMKYDSEKNLVNKLVNQKFNDEISQLKQLIQ